MRFVGWKRTGGGCGNHRGARAKDCRQQVFGEGYRQRVAPEAPGHLPHSEKVSWNSDV